MARITRPEFTEEYIQLRDEADSIGENNDCAIKAISLVSGLNYIESKRLIDFYGRNKKGGTPTETIIKAIDQIGLIMTPIIQKDIIKMYPGVHSGLKSITSHHMDRFNSVWKNGKRYLLFSKTHVWAVIDGLNHDHTRGRSVQCKWIYEITNKKPILNGK